MIFVNRNFRYFLEFSGKYPNFGRQFFITYFRHFVSAGKLNKKTIFKNITKIGKASNTGPIDLYTGLRARSCRN